MIPMTAVQSSNINAVGHENDTLAVQFKSGQIYHYPGVPRSIYDGMIASESVGKFFAAHVRPKFEGVRQEEAKA